MQIKPQICHFVPIKIDKFHKHYYPGYKSKIRNEYKYFSCFLYINKYKITVPTQGQKTLLNGVIGLMTSQ